MEALVAIITASKLGDGESFRVAILSEEPLEYFTVWGESAEGQKKPFRFVSEPSPSDIESELGEFTQRQNYEQTGLEKPKFGLSFFCFDYADEKGKSLRDHPKNPDEGVGWNLAVGRLRRLAFMGHGV